MKKKTNKITLKIAIQFLLNHYSVDTQNYSAINDDAAEEITKYNDTKSSFSSEPELNLRGLDSLSKNSANSLAKFKGDLNLSGLTAISTEVSDALAYHRGTLYLSGLETLSEESATNLAKHQGGLWLYGIIDLSDEAAAALSKHKEGRLFINFQFKDTAGHHLLLERLSQESDLDLTNTEYLSPHGACILGRNHNGKLLFKHLSELNYEVALELSKHNGSLLFGYQIKTLSDEIASILSNFQDELILNGLEKLEDTPGKISLSKKLVKQKVDFGVPSLKFIGDECANILSTFSGNIKLSYLQILNDSPGHIALAKKIFSTKNNDIWLNNLSSIPDSIAEIIPSYNGNLFLEGIKSINDFVATQLSHFKGRIVLRNLESLSENNAKLLFKTHPELRDYISSLTLN